MTTHYNPDAFKYLIITEEELKTWETGKWKGKRYTQIWLREVKLPEIRSRPHTPAAPSHDNAFNEAKFREELKQYLYRYVVIPSDIQRDVFERDIISCARGCVYPVPVDTATIRNQTLDKVYEYFITMDDDSFIEALKSLRTQSTDSEATDQ